MATFTVHFTQQVSGHRAVDIDPEPGQDSQDLAQAAIEEAEMEGLPGLCHQCVGMLRKDWGRDESGDWEPVAVTDENGAEVWAAEQDQAAHQ